MEICFSVVFWHSKHRCILKCLREKKPTWKAALSIPIVMFCTSLCDPSAFLKVWNQFSKDSGLVNLFSVVNLFSDSFFGIHRSTWTWRASVWRLVWLEEQLCNSTAIYLITSYENSWLKMVKILECRLSKGLKSHGCWINNVTEMSCHF